MTIKQELEANLAKLSQRREQCAQAEVLCEAQLEQARHNLAFVSGQVASTKDALALLEAPPAP